jgi:phage-related protein
MNVVREKPEHPRKLVWLVDSLDRLTGFPPAVRQKLGFALYQAQIGQKHESEEVARLCRDGLAGACRRSGWDVSCSVCDTGWEPVYVLHAFQKKATSGIATPQRELDLIRQRLQLARKLVGK